MQSKILFIVISVISMENCKLKRAIILTSMRLVRNAPSCDLHHCEIRFHYIRIREFYWDRVNESRILKNLLTRFDYNWNDSRNRELADNSFNSFLIISRRGGGG